MADIITLDVQKTITLVAAQTQTITEAEILKYEDDPIAKFVQARVKLGSTSTILTLWEGTTYDSIGNWTTAQAIARAKEILQA